MKALGIADERNANALAWQIPEASSSWSTIVWLMAGVPGHNPIEIPAIFQFYAALNYLTLLTGLFFHFLPAHNCLWTVVGGNNYCICVL